MRSTTTASFKTARLSLSLVRESDRENLVALERDPQVMRFLNGGRSTPDDGENGASFLAPRGGENYVWAARETRSGAFLGRFSLRPVDEGVAELGYRLRREAWAVASPPRAPRRSSSAASPTWVFCASSPLR
jgi:RimJ/RimL family protein N-acetyltransferase